jgi:DNA-binding NarL/FixJ family response regulator
MTAPPNRQIEVMIRAVVIDRHPAMRAGIKAILTRTPDVLVVATASGQLHELEHMLYRTAPDVVVVEDALGGLDGVALARVIRALPSAPRVVVHAEDVDATLVAAAMLAGADGLVDSRDDAAELVAAVRSAARGMRRFPDVDAADRAELERRLASSDHAILRMLFAAFSPREIAALLRLDAGTLRARFTAMIELLRPARAALTLPATC